MCHVLLMPMEGLPLSEVVDAGGKKGRQGEVMGGDEGGETSVNM